MMSNVDNLTATLDPAIIGAHLESADLTGADLHGADLSEADLFGANLRGANLADADLRQQLSDNGPRCQILFIDTTNRDDVLP